MLQIIRRRPPTGGLLTLALFIQFGLIWRAFSQLFTQPGQHLFVTSYDGIKNYFTFQSYLRQPFEKGLSWFGNMNYPFGDYIFYTDNTPLLAILVKLFSHYVYDLTPYGLDVYHAFLASGLLVSTALLVLILRRLLRTTVLVLAFSLFLPWLNPQLGRLTVGHFNLSLSWVLLLAIWGLLRIYERGQAGRPVGRWVAGLVAGLTVAAFLHLYYLPVVGLCTGAFFAFWLWSTGRWREWRLVLAGAGVTLLPLLLSVGVVRLVDAYYSLRLSEASGFNYLPWKLQFSAFFQPYSYERTHFIIEPIGAVPYESQAYLGIFALAGLTAAAGVALVRRSAWRAWWRAWCQTEQLTFLLLLGGAALVGVFVAFGTEYKVAGDQFVFNNYLSVFYYLHKFTDAAAHFRAVGRFSWPFFWAVNLFVLAGLDYWLASSRERWRWLVAAAFILLAWLDTRDTLKHYRHALLPNTLTNAANQPEASALLATIRPEEYQAILPVPYFHVGSEDLDLTIDDDDRHATHAYQLSMRTGLPLLASKMSRTPPAHVAALESLFAAEGPAADLRFQLQAHGKPVLVFFDEAYYDGTYRLADAQRHPIPRRIIQAGPELLERYHLTPIATAGKLRLYRWDVP